MRWYDALWVGPGASRQKRRLISSVEKHKPVAGTYIITLAQNPSELLDIVPVGMRAGDVSVTEDTCILGIAMGKREAFELVKKMVDYIYRETGALNIREYFSE